MFDTTIHLGDVLAAAAFLVGGSKFAITVRDKIKNLEQTVFGSEIPPIEGLVAKVQRHEKTLKEIR